MKIVAVTQRVDSVEKYREKRDALDQRWCHLLTKCDLIPLVIPNRIEVVQSLLEKIPLDGIVLTGGNDTPERKCVENILLDKAISDRLPLLGVCHGMQSIQRYFNIILEPVKNHVCDKQEIVINGKSDTVNSYHELGTNYTASPLKVWARAADGIIKAVQHEQLPITGIMWHPERIVPYAERDINLIKNIFSKASL